jgi:hypothetical protein
VLAQKVLCIGTQALDVHGAAQDNRVIGLNALDLPASVQSTLTPDCRRVSASASAISAVEPRFEAYAIRTFVTFQGSCATTPA